MREKEGRRKIRGVVVEDLRKGRTGDFEIDLAELLALSKKTV